MAGKLAGILAKAGRAFQARPTIAGAMGLPTVMEQERARQTQLAPLIAQGNIQDALGVASPFEGVGTADIGGIGALMAPTRLMRQEGMLDAAFPRPGGAVQEFVPNTAFPGGQNVPQSQGLMESDVLRRIRNLFRASEGIGEMRGAAR